MSSKTVRMNNQIVNLEENGLVILQVNRAFHKDEIRDYHANPDKLDKTLYRWFTELVPSFRSKFVNYKPGDLTEVTELDDNILADGQFQTHEEAGYDRVGACMVFSAELISRNLNDRQFLVRLASEYSYGLMDAVRKAVRDYKFS